jgi:hypothetical protein
VIRAVPITSDQHAVVEQIGMALMRQGSYDDATVLMSIALAWKYAPVVSFGDDSDTLAEVVDFPGHSVKAPPCR